MFPYSNTEEKNMKREDSVALAAKKTRREFLKQSSTAAIASAIPLLIPKNVHSEIRVRRESLRIGVVGAGGRGTDAVSNALAASSEVQVIALADLAEERIERSRNSIMTQWGNTGKALIEDANCFVGVDAYEKLCEHPDVDIIIHTTPPGLRHLTLRAAVENKKHSFVEKPVCVDPTTYRHVLESGKLASDNGLAIVSGTQYRREMSYMDAIQQLHDGIIGQVTSAFAYYCSGELWLNGNEQDWKRWGGIEGMEYQMRNWLYFTWLSGDHIAEQAVHNIDAINWGLKAVPEKAWGSGGRTRRTDKKYGDVYDHFSIDYDYPGDVRVSFKCRQMSETKGRVANRFCGTKGIMDIRPNPGRTATIVRDLSGKMIWNNNGRVNNAPYEQEHADLIASIRAGTPIQEIMEVANSSLTAVIGREAAYSGQEVNFDWAAKESTQSLAPTDITAKSNPVRDVPIPGVYKLS
jgi:predicted dehydrogenase